MSFGEGNMMRILSLAALGMALFASAATYPQSYPDRPIRMIVPSAPGGLPDTQARLIANEIGKQMGQQVVVENRPGASGVIGFETVARATPDGYTIGYATPLRPSDFTAYGDVRQRAKHAAVEREGVKSREETLVRHEIWRY